MSDSRSRAEDARSDETASERVKPEVDSLKRSMIEQWNTVREVQRKLKEIDASSQAENGDDESGGSEEVTVKIELNKESMKKIREIGSQLAYVNSHDPWTDFEGRRNTIEEYAIQNIVWAGLREFSIAVEKSESGAFDVYFDYKEGSLASDYLKELEKAKRDFNSLRSMVEESLKRHPKK